MPVFIRPIMEDPLEVIDICLDWLLCEEGMGLEFHPRGQLRRESGNCAFDNLRHILDNEMKRTVSLRKRSSDMSSSSANIGPNTVAKSIPAAVIEYIGNIEALTRGVRLHGVCESPRTYWIRANNLLNGLCGVVRKSKPLNCDSTVSVVLV